MGQSEKSKYPALRIIAAWYKTVGYVIGGIIVISAVIGTFINGLNIASFGIGIAGVVFIIMSMSIAEIIQVFLDTESSTRSSANSLRELVELKKEPGESAPCASDASAAPEEPVESEKLGRPEKTPEPIKKPVAKPAKPAPNKVAPNSEQAKSIKNLIKHLHGDGLTASEIVRELRAENIQTLDGAARWTEKAVHDVLLSG